MSDPTVTDPPATPEPVLDEAKVASSIVGVTTAALTVATGLGLHLASSVAQVTQVEAVAVGAIVTLINIFVPLWRGARARSKVTPVAAPRDAHGRPLVPQTLVTSLANPTTVEGEQLIALSVARAMAASAAADAAVNGKAAVLPVGKPTPTPWATDSTIIPHI